MDLWLHKHPRSGRSPRYVQKMRLRFYVGRLSAMSWLLFSTLVSAALMRALEANDAEKAIFLTTKESNDEYRTLARS